jgi:hypothetical protein
MTAALRKQFGIDFPLFAFSHCRDVVAAATNAGGFWLSGFRRATAMSSTSCCASTASDPSPTAALAVLSCPAIPAVSCSMSR